MADILGFVAIGVCVTSFLSGILPLVQYKDLDLPDDLKSSLQATQAMVFLGLFADAGSLVALIMWRFVRKEMKILGLIAGGLAIAGGLFFMIGMTIYADKWKQTTLDYGAGFVSDILGWLTAWASGGIVLYMRFTGTRRSAAS